MPTAARSRNLHDSAGHRGAGQGASVWHRPARLGAQPKKAPRIILFGLFGSGNLGNDGSLEAMVEFLRRERPDAELLCVCGNPDHVKERLAIDALAIRRASPASGLRSLLNRLFLKIPGKIADLAWTLNHARWADVLLFPGTGILDDFGEKPNGMPYDIVKWCLAARLARRRVAFVSIGAGPIRNRLSRLFMTSAARLAHYRSYRDLQSREFMEAVGVDTSNDEVFPDLAFGLPRPAGFRAGDTGALRVGVGVMAYRGWYGFAEGGQSIFSRYIHKMAEFVIHLLDCGHEVRLLVGDAEDEVAVQALLAALGEQGRAVSPSYRQPHSLGDVMEQIAQTDVVVATRFHNIVCALAMGRPVISLSYARKNDVLMAEVGLEEYCQHVETFDVKRLAAQFSRLQDARSAHEPAIAARVEALRVQLARQERRLLATVIGGSWTRDVSFAWQASIRSRQAG